MSQELGGCLEELAFGSSCVKPFFLKDLEDLRDVLLMFLEGLGEDQDIVEVDDHESIQERPEEVVHEPLESAGSVAEAKGHDKALVVSVPCLESGLVNMVFEDFNLVVAAFEIDFRKEFGTTKAIEKVIDPRQGVSILDGLLVERSVVVADAQRAILLGNEQDRRCVRRRAGTDPSGFDFFLNKVAEGFEFLLGVPIERTVDRSRTRVFVDPMLDSTVGWKTGRKFVREDGLKAIDHSFGQFGKGFFRRARAGGLGRRSVWSCLDVGKVYLVGPSELVHGSSGDDRNLDRGCRARTGFLWR
jgi:hypothetical protein